LLRKTTYETLSLLCQTLKYGSQVETLAEPLIEHILHDILPFHDEITLKMQATGNNLSKKAKKKMRKQQNDSTVLSLTHSTPSQGLNSKRFQEADVGNEVLCAAALSALQSIFECCGCFIKPVLHRLLHETVVAQCFAISAATPRSVGGLYSSTECRRKLYGALHALVMNPHHLCPAPLQYAATIFGLAQTNDSNPDVRAAAAGFGRSLEKILHPQKAVFHFDAEENDIKAALRNVKALKKKMLDHEDSESEEESEEEIEEKDVMENEESDEVRK
jgi:proline-, glutamic acid- and leucine-rich protein 1